MTNQRTRDRARHHRQHRGVCTRLCVRIHTHTRSLTHISSDARRRPRRYRAAWSSSVTAIRPSAPINVANGCANTARLLPVFLLPIHNIYTFVDVLFIVLLASSSFTNAGNHCIADTSTHTSTGIVS